MNLNSCKISVSSFRQEVPEQEAQTVAEASAPFSCSFSEEITI